jgi:cell wall-associated NlpC family hydrolase
MFDLVGLPYSFPSSPPESFDCWTLVKHARERLGLPSPLPFKDDEPWCVPANIERAIAKARVFWTTRAGAPQDGDMAVMMASHVGLYWQGGVVHALASNATVVWSSDAVVRRLFPGTEWWHT